MNLHTAPATVPAAAAAGTWVSIVRCLVMCVCCVSGSTPCVCVEACSTCHPRFLGWCCADWLQGSPDYVMHIAPCLASCQCNWPCVCLQRASCRALASDSWPHEESGRIYGCCCCCLVYAFWLPQLLCVCSILYSVAVLCCGT